MNLKRKTAVVTGATGGIGRPLAEELAKKGTNLILISRTEEKLQKLMAQLAGEGHHYFVHDATETEKISKLADDISVVARQVDLLFNAAGVGVYKTIEDVTRAKWEESFAINVTTPFFLTKQLLPQLNKANKARVINIGSGMSEKPTACRSVYCSTKYALRGMTLSLAAEFHNSSIDFIHVELGSTLTEFGPLSIEEKKKLSLEGKAYLTPEWVAKKLVELVRANELDSEITLYPSGYSI